MKRKIILKLKSCKGFTMEDLTIAIAIFTVFAGIVGAFMLATFKVQSNSQVDEVATIYAVQIAEYIDKISFEEVESGIGDELATRFNVPTNFTVTVDVSDYRRVGETESYVKDVDINVEYSFRNDSRNVRFKRLKIKEM